jgi:hypothetical protein
MSHRTRLRVAARLVPILLPIATLNIPVASRAQQSIARDPLPSRKEGRVAGPSSTLSESMRTTRARRRCCKQLKLEAGQK